MGKILIIAVLMVCISTVWCKVKIPNIAIIGGGIGGTSTAYFLRELFGLDATIDLYESDKIGGRLATIPIGSSKYESGGSVIHPKNKYMVDFVKTLGQRKRKDESPSKFGMFDGSTSEFVYEETSWEIINIVKLFWRYGYGMLKLNSQIEEFLREFSRIYKLQSRGQCYASVRELVNAMGPNIAAGLERNAKLGFAQRGFSNLIVDELVSATLATNYGQDTNVTELVGMVSMAGASSGLWSVNGGNFRVAERLLTRSGATLIHAPVKSVAYAAKTADYRIDAGAGNGTGELAAYDIVVVAAPLTADKSKLEFVNVPNLSFPGEFHRTVTTIVKGKVDFNYFGLTSEADMVDEVFYIKLGNFFHSLGRISPVDDSEGSLASSDVWKLFSSKQISDDDLHKVFMEIESVERVDWLAYPQYTSVVRDDSFVLHDHLYHVNAIEWAASAMEMSAIGAKNVALLAYKRWNNQPLTDAGARVGDEL